MFTGTKNIPQGEYDRICMRAGGENNAYTTFDKTGYYLLLPSHHLETGLWLESDRLLGFNVNEKALRTQIDVIIEEKKQTCDNKPYGSVDIEFAPRLFGNSAYGWDIIGFPEDLRNCSLEDARKFYESYYTPANAILTVTGDIDYDKTYELIEKYFSKITGNYHKKPDKKINIEPKGEIREIIYDSVQLPGLFIAYRIPRENSPYYYAFNLLSVILSSGESSRFFKSLVYEKQLVSEIGCFIDPRELAGVFNIFAFAMPGVTLNEIEEEVNSVLNDILTKSFTDFEFQKALNKIEMRYYLLHQSILGKSEMLSHYKTIYNNPSIINTLLDNYNSLTKEKVVSLTSEFLKSENRVVLGYIPKK
jgi:predicted Zn-dependent peptidase